MNGAKRPIALITLLSMVFVQTPLPLGAQEPLAAPKAGARAGETALPARSERRIDPAVGGIVALDGVSVELPAGALKESTRISIQRLSAVEALGDGIANVTAGAQGYRFEPRGTAFAKPVTIRVPFDRRLLASEAGLSNLYTYFFDERSGRWERLARTGIDRAAATIASSSTHFTDMINATLRLPEGPKPIQFDVNSIKSLAAANPGEAVPMPEGPEPGAFGSNSFSLPLRLPPGRGGAAPQLALTYSSDSSNGWLGRGFDIEVPAIAIDTRFGLPKYDGHDLYSLGGEELVPVEGGGSSVSLYRPRVEKDFRLIKRIRGGGEDYWETTDKDGTVREYGRGEGWIGPDRNDRARTFIWYLTKQRDSFGNAIEYGYDYDSTNVYTYLSEMRYASHESGGVIESGAFKVDFTRADREDRRIDSRGEFLSKLASRLSRIDVYFGDAKVRSYLLDYGGYNEFGQSQLRRFTETDGAGAKFYSYDFEYYAMSAHDDGSGDTGHACYDGFGKGAEKMGLETWDLGSAGKYDGLSSSINASVGGSLALGASFYVPRFWRPGKKMAANLSVHAGIGASIGGSASALLDANGDGLPDLAWRENGTLYAYLNTGAGFDSSKAYPMNGLSAVMDKEESFNLSYGASASLSGVGAGVTRQESWSTSDTSFADVNGDGLMDFVKKGDDRFDLNVGSGFSSTQWQFGDAASPSGASDYDDAKYQAIYYLEEPTRAWEAWRSGTVEVEQSGALLDSGRARQVALCTYAPGSQTDAASWFALPGIGTCPSKRYAVNPRDRFFFRVDTEGDDRKAGVTWHIQIRYTAIGLFDGLKGMAAFDPPETLAASEIRGLAALYTYDQYNGNYARNKNWRDSADLDVYRTLADKGYFIPRKVPGDAYRRMLAEAEAAKDNIGDPALEGTGGISQYQMLYFGYGYEAETDSFLRMSPSDAPDEKTATFLDSHKGDIDSAFEKYISIDGVTNAQREAIALAKGVDGEGYVVTSSSNGASWYDRTAPQVTLDAAIESSDRYALAADGLLVDGMGLLLETRVEPGTGESERLWYRTDEKGAARLYRESDGEETEDVDAQPIAKSGPDTLSIGYKDRGVDRSFTLSGKTSLIAKLPDRLYSGKASDHLLAGKSFSADSFAILPSATWKAIDGNLSTVSDGVDLSDKAVFEAWYATSADGSGYALDRSIPAATLERILLLIHAKGAQSPFDVLPEDPEGALRFILLAPSDYSAFLSAEGGDLADDFTPFSDASHYYPSLSIGSAETPRLLGAMRRYYRDTQAFPYYDYDSSHGVWRLKSGLSTAQKRWVADALSACNLAVYTGLAKSIRYSSEQLLKVSQTRLPAGAKVEEFAPAGGKSDRAGQEVGVVYVPGFDSDWKSVLKPRYVHDFDSAGDYSSKNLAATPDASYMEARSAYFPGGVYGWYYGLWTGNYPWDSLKLGRLPAQDEAALDNGGVANPPYYTEAAANAQSDGSQMISECGRDKEVPVSPEAWVGDVASYSDAAMSDDLSISAQTCHFAAFIDGDELYPGRKGGDSYYRLPKADGATGAWMSLSFIRKSHSRSTDWNFPGGISKNTSSSWQYCGLIDMNGDRYPDLLHSGDAEKGSYDFNVLYGNGGGFGSGQRYSLPRKGWLSENETTTWSIGASSTAVIGAVQQIFSPKGKPESATPQQDGKSSTDFGLSASFGSSVQAAGFYDINGDGLPDYVSRSGSGAYDVALNRGDGNFEGVDWGASCISAEAFNGLPGGDIPLKGISHTSVGSFGGSVNVDFPIAKARFSVGVSGNANQTLSNLVDVNGDGLPDIVVKEPGDAFFRVRFNQGDHFADKETRLYRPEWPDDLKDFKLNVSRDLQMLVAGLNGIDLLGVDLSSYIPDLGSVAIPGTGGDPFLAAVNPLRIDDDLEYSTGANFNLGANVSFGFSWWLLDLYIQPGINGSVARTSVDLKFADIDGDGLPDHVLKMPGSDKVYVKRNRMGQVGLLKAMGLPQGGTYEFEYERAGNTTSMPQSRWVLSKLTKDDGASGLCGDRGAHRYAEGYAYSSGNYDRGERMFFGFQAVSASKADGSVSTAHYLNKDYYERGMSSGSEITGLDFEGQKTLFDETLKTISLYSVPNGRGKMIYFPAVTGESKRHYEAGSSTYIETSKTYGYDDFGNVKYIADKGLTDESGDDLYAEIRYAGLPGNLKQFPSSIRVMDSAGKLVRLRTGSYGSSGELLSLEEYDSGSAYRRHGLTYDKGGYGNLVSVTDPRGYCIAFEYDDLTHGYPTRIARGNAGMGSPTYSSSATWDYALGQRLSETDENGQSMSYSYDSFGRPTETRSPYDTGSLAAVKHGYDLSVFPWTATTSNKLLYDQADGQTIRTIVCIDGLGRVLQTAKEGEYRDGAGTRHFGWNLSGAVAYDGKGRTSSEGQPQFAEGSAVPSLAAMAKATVASYDALDRVVRKLLPDGAAMSVEYLVSGDRLVERNTDPMGNVGERKRDGRGNVTAMSRLSNSGATLMSASYIYDAIGELLTAADSKGNTLSATYDLSGKRTSLESSDTGKVILSYDAAGNLAKKTDAVLRSHGEAITYEYDGHERLAKVLYPKSAATVYLYGDASAETAAKGGAGRLMKRTDESGSVSYEYGKLGETVAMTRVIDRLTPLADDVSARFEYLSDYLGRLQRITYPDGEILSYGYDSGGQVKTVKSTHNNLETNYVADIAYNAFGERTYIEYGNGVRTSYAYDENRRWLSSIRTAASFGAVHQSMDYRFDLVGNVLGYANRAGTYDTSQSYGYDGLYQLTSAKGTSVYHPYGMAEYTSLYSQSFAYDAIGNMTSKLSASSTSPARSVGDDLNYSYAYVYYAGKAHQAERIGNLYYRYDGNGNTIEEREGGHGTSEVLAGIVSGSGDLRMTDTGFGIARTLGSGPSGTSVYARSYAWDEENRLVRSADNSIAVDYRYGADGLRAVKYSMNGESLYFDSMWSCQTDYPDLRQMKNIYVGQTRIATRLDISGDGSTGYERQNTYYYHPDHLGSAHLVTDYQGKEYERIEYTPYGESWIEKNFDGLELLPYKFTGKELDSETGLYYYGARYMNPKTSNWLSADPALVDYIPVAPVDDEARKRNRNLPGQGGVFNLVNLAVYHYAGNNPVRYTDPMGLAEVEGTGRESNSYYDKVTRSIREVIPAQQEEQRARQLANRDPHPTYGSNSDLAGQEVPMDRSQYDCASELSAVAEKPLRSTAELANPSTRAKNYTDVPSGQQQPGDWLFIRYTLPGSSDELGHLQMILPNNQYADSADVGANPGPRITTGNPCTTTVPNVLNGTINLSVIIRPKR
jgi:RHS repeat-associated protein